MIDDIIGAVIEVVGDVVVDGAKAIGEVVVDGAQAVGEAIGDVFSDGVGTDVADIASSGTSTAEPTGATAVHANGAAVQGGGQSTRGGIGHVLIHTLDGVDLFGSDDRRKKSDKNLEIYQDMNNGLFITFKGDMDFSESETTKEPCGLPKYFIIGDYKNIKYEVVSVNENKYFVFQSQHQLSNVRSVQVNTEGKSMYLLVSK